MNEIQFLISLGRRTTQLPSPRLPCPALGHRDPLMVWDGEKDGNVFIRDANGQTVPDTRRSKFAVSVR